MRRCSIATGSRRICGATGRSPASSGLVGAHVAVQRGVPPVRSCGRGGTPCLNAPLLHQVRQPGSEKAGNGQVAPRIHVRVAIEIVGRRLSGESLERVMSRKPMSRSIGENVLHEAALFGGDRIVAPEVRRVLRHHDYCYLTICLHFCQSPHEPLDYRYTEPGGMNPNMIAQQVLHNGRDFEQDSLDSHSRIR